MVVIKTGGHYMFVDGEYPSLDKALNRARALVRSIRIEGGEAVVEVIVFEEKKRYRKKSAGSQRLRDVETVVVSH